MYKGPVRQMEEGGNLVVYRKILTISPYLRERLDRHVMDSPKMKSPLPFVFLSSNVFALHRLWFMSTLSKKPIQFPRGQRSVLHPLVQIGSDLEGLCTDVLTVQFSKEVNKTHLRRKNFYKAKWVLKARCNYCKVLYKCRFPKVEVSKAIVNYRNSKKKTVSSLIEM